MLNAIAAMGLALLLDADHGLLLGVHAGIAASLFFVVPALGVIYLFERRPLQLFFINAGYQVVNFTVMGAILGLWPLDSPSMPAIRTATPTTCAR